MRNHCLALGLACAAPAVLAEDFPARYDVTTNNGRGYELRAAPDASAPAIGQIPDDRQGLQVVRLSEGGDWGLVTYGERSAWVAMAHLTRQPAPQATALPMRCYGTEPFWGLNFPTGFFAEFERPEHPEEPFQIAGMAESTGSQGRIKAWSFISDASRAT
ncbi:MAG: SH3 domain-containing protein, partial [Mangrovicoccus sp.]